MIKTVTLQDFKCFHEEQPIRLAPVTLMYGKNGRGKSSVVQSLLLLAQNMRVQNSVAILSLTGELTNFGTFGETLYQPADNQEFRIALDTEKERVVMGFSAYGSKTQLARLSTFNVNGMNRMETYATAGTDVKGRTDAKADAPQQTVVTSDIDVLQDLKNITFVSAGRRGPVNSASRNDALRPDWIGTEGENLINVLANKGVDFIKDVEQHLSQILSGAAIHIPNPEADIIDLQLNSVDGTSYFRPANVGFGYSYVLPVITATLLAEKGSILIIENPEAHLHPGAQSRLTKFIINMAKEKELQVVMETHSDHVVNGMRIAMKQGLLKPQDAVVVYFAHDNGTTAPTITTITCDKNGTLSEYPDDFMDEWTQQMFQLV